MAKSRWIGFRVSETDMQKIEALKNKRSTTKFFKDLIDDAVKNEQQEVNNFIELLKKIENTDTAKTAEKVDEIIKSIKILNNNIVKTFRKLERVEIMSEELANTLIIRSDFRQKFFERVEQRAEEKQQ